MNLSEEQVYELYNEAADVTFFDQIVNREVLLLYIDLVMEYEDEFSELLSGDAEEAAE